MEPVDLRQSALFAVDLQRGFTVLCPDELPVPGGVEIVPAVNRLLELPWLRVDACQDWHPPDHCSFFGRAHNLYPPHCILGTAGSEFLPGLRTELFHTIWRKGFQRDVEAYAVTAQHPSLPVFFRAQGIGTMVLCGIATNICCYLTARDFHRAGFRTLIVEDASAGIDVPAAGLYQAAAKADGQRLGIEYARMRDFLAAAH